MGALPQHGSEYSQAPGKTWGSEGVSSAMVTALTIVSPVLILLALTALIREIRRLRQ